MAFQVDITIGAHSWSLTSHVDDDDTVTVTDGIAVLDGLDLSWSMPRGTWPRQPDPMQASLALNLPRFDDLDVQIDDQCAIEIRDNEASGLITARFYGDVSDAKATSRPGRPGVFLSVVAVDYTARLAELPAAPGLAVGGYTSGVTEANAVNYTFANAGLAGNPLGQWTTPTRYLGDTTDLTVNPGDYLKALLDQAVNYGSSSDLSRMIIAPMVEDGILKLDGSGHPTYALDTIEVPLTSSGLVVPYEIPASFIRREISWSASKSGMPSWLDVTSNGGDTGWNALTRRSTSLGGVATESMSVNCSTQEEAEDVAGFYTIHGLPPWQIDPVTIPATRAGLTDEVFASLFPDWTAAVATVFPPAVADPARVAPYNLFLSITDVPTDKHPRGYDHIGGWLTGAACRLSGGHLEYDLTLRRDQFVE